MQARKINNTSPKDFVKILEDKIASIRSLTSSQKSKSPDFKKILQREINLLYEQIEEIEHKLNLISDYSNN